MISGHVRVDRLVVGDTGADRVREAHAPEPVRGDEPRHAEQRVAAKGERVEEVIVDAAIDDIDALAPLRGAHEHARIVDEEIGALHELHAHRLREKGVLEVRGVVRAGREQHDHRIVRRGRRDRAQHVEQILRIALHRPNIVVLKELRPRALEHAPILDDVRHARRRAQVVLEHHQLTPAIAHEIAADDVRVHAERNVDLAELATVAARAEHELGRDHARAQDALVVIHVVQKEIERAHALLEPALDPRPLIGLDDPRNEIEGHDLLHALRALIHREGDSAHPERQLRRALTSRDVGGAQRREAARERRVVRAHNARRLEHLVPENAGIVVGDDALGRGGSHSGTICASTTQASFFGASRLPAIPVYDPDVGATSA